MATEAQIRANRENAKKAGRKRGYKAIQAEKAREYIVKRVSAELKPIMDKAIEQAKAGDSTSRKDLMDRAYGRPIETIQVESEIRLLVDV